MTQGADDQDRQMRRKPVLDGSLAIHPQGKRPLSLEGVGGRAALLLAIASIGLTSLAACERTASDQRGPRGTSQIQVVKPEAVARLAELNVIPPPEDPADLESPPATETFVNVKVLTDVSATEFSRLMQALSTWVSPVEGCDFCHDSDNLETDDKYTKVVARRMLEMTRRINTEWKSHVGETGVTCWTCHRGEAVPSGDWFADPGLLASVGFIGRRNGQNTPSPNAGGSALPSDPLSTYLTDAATDIRVQGTTPLKTRDRPPSIQETEWTYALMMYMSDSLGVNCTYCHNTRALARWEESSPQRATAWHGIRMVRMLNTEYLTPMTPLFPEHRLGPSGDAPKVGCATCHKGTFKPLNGVSPLADYPILAGVGKVPAGTPTPPEEPEPPPKGKKVASAAAAAGVSAASAASAR
jgi:photosynthetic reaction center cytochrome c subunit